MRRHIESIVIDKLGLLVRFWELRARHATRGEPFTSSEQLELLDLMHLVTSDLKMPSPGPCMRPSNAIASQMLGQGRIVPVEVRHVSAAAMLFSCPAALTPGNRIVLQMADAVSGVEYVIPCVVYWVFGMSPWIVAVVVDGSPTRSELLTLPEPRALNALPIRPYARRVG